MLSAGEFRKGLTFEMDGNIYTIVDFQHVKPGKGAAFVRTKIKNIITLATPGDFSIDNNLLSVWTRNINPDTIADTFGNIPGAFINSAFLLRSCKSHFYLVVV